MADKGEFLELRRRYIERCFSHLNEQQRRAALSTEGPLLILAGAGSGKTTVVVNRINCLIRFGNAYSSDFLAREPSDGELAALKSAAQTGGPLPDELLPLMRAGGVEPWNILAITFTNKAAGELKSRICAAVGDAGREVFASTFHSACVRILRSHADLLGFPKSFTIYDSDDTGRVLKEICKQEGIDDRMFPPRWLAGRISRLKDELVSPDENTPAQGDLRAGVVARVYKIYQSRLKKAGAFDFDDLIFYTVRLLSDNPEVRERYHRRFRYVMVDEYQDTSYAQYRLVSLLTGAHRNLCVVGDDDQSIYRFRGATVENILGFENAFPGAGVIRLEQNYRSTSRILDAANEVISHNTGRKGKKLWTDVGDGERITVYRADDETDEARFVLREVLGNREAGIPLSSQAVLYRMNAQSNSVENLFARSGLPYRVIGGLRFYDRAEVKDIISYLSIVENPADDLRLMRILNRPARKIGGATVTAIADIAAGLGVPMLEVIREAEHYPDLSRAKKPLADFAQMYDRLCEESESCGLGDFVQRVIELTGYRDMLVAQGDEGATRLQNVDELVSAVRAYQSENPDGDLAGFLEEISLVAGIDSYDENADAVVLMTLHSAKGLEFDCVYMIGMEEGIFPGEQSRYNRDDVEEERRLAYVGITRAKRKLYLTHAETRMLFGRTSRNMRSRFVDEFSPELREEQGVERKPSWRTGAPAWGSPAQNEYRRANGMANDLIDGRRPAPGPSYGRAKPFEGISVGGARPGAAAAGKKDYKKGDRVAHRVFGEGTVLSAKALGGDTLLEIAFDTAGVKKAMANYAPMEKL